MEQQTEAKRTHRSRYIQSLTDLMYAGVQPDKHWLSALWVLTASVTLWGKVKPLINLEQQTIGFDDINELQASEILLIRAARNLFNGEGSVDLAQIAETLDHRLFQAVVDAWDSTEQPNGMSSTSYILDTDRYRYFSLATEGIQCQKDLAVITGPASSRSGGTGVKWA